MRTGAEYREALRDGRRVWVIGEGLVEDVTVHPATRGTVDEYVAWYDRHFDREWQDTLLTPPDAAGARAPLSYIIPKSPDDLRAMGRCFSATTNAAGYRELIARTGRFLTFAAGAATIGYRMRQDPGERAALKLVRETDAGLVVSGKVGMHTSPVYAEDVYVGSHCGIERGQHRATFIVPVAAPGVTILCRKIAARHSNPFLAPLSSRFDELDGQMWLDNVLIPWDRIFLMDVTPEPMASWLFWHQLYCWLSKAEFTLGLALALGLAAARVRPRHLGAGRSRVGLRAPRQRRYSGVARTAAPLLHPLQRARERRPAHPESRHAEGRSRAPARGRPGAATPRHPAAVARGRIAAIARRQRRTVPGTSPSGMKTTMTTKMAPRTKFHRSM